MTATVFVWNMFRGFDVGHASLHITGPQGSVYISFWPQKHNPVAALLSQGKIHFMNGDRAAEDGTASWASKPLDDFDEVAIIRWWSKIQHNPYIDYEHKKPFQTSSSETTYFQQSNGQLYDIFWNQCSTTVVTALLIGSNTPMRIRMAAWLALNAGTNIGPIKLFPPYRLPTITPTDVKKLVISIWNDF